jgi:hypothetical protein
MKVMAEQIKALTKQVRHSKQKGRRDRKQHMRELDWSLEKQQRDKPEILTRYLVILPTRLGTGYSCTTFPLPARNWD